MEREQRILCSLNILAKRQCGEASAALCTAFKIPEVGPVPSVVTAEVFSCTFKDPKWIHAVTSSARTCPSHALSEAEVYCSPPKKKTRLMNKDGSSGKMKSGKGTIVVDLVKLTAEDKNESEVNNYKHQSTKLLSGSIQSEQSFFPLAVDDYFMAVAILCKDLGEDEGDGACIVSNDSLHVVSIGYCKGGLHAELLALLNAKQCRVDLTKCSLYTTKPPCHNCTEAILQAGIRVVVYGDVRDGYQLVGDNDRLGKDVYDLVYKAKACFKKYECYIRIEDGEKKFLINLSERVIEAKQLDQPDPLDPLDPPADQLQEASNCFLKQLTIHKFYFPSEGPSYRDFFMAMAFLAHTRSKDIKYQVGACLVTPSPHRLVAMGYNGMPDGHSFKDNKMDWGSHQSEYNCHSEVNTIIAAFRREADLSACTLYVTHSPCEDCSKLVAQSGIKNVVFAKYFHNGKAMYETLGRVPDMNITRYEYMESGYGNIARILINLKDLSIKLTDSSTIPQTEWKPEEDRGRCPTCLQMGYEKPNGHKCPLCHREVHEQPKGIQEKGRRDVDFPLDDYFMSLAVLAKCRSRLKEDKRVGACIVYQEPRRAVSVGYSGHIDGLSDGKRNDYECCAEFNAIVSAFRYHADLTTATLYTTGVPCPRCATKIVQSGIKTVVYGEKKDKMENETKEILYWAKVATLEYTVQTKKPCIEIDLRGLVVEQRAKL